MRQPVFEGTTVRQHGEKGEGKRHLKESIRARGAAKEGCHHLEKRAFLALLEVGWGRPGGGEEYSEWHLANLESSAIEGTAMEGRDTWYP